MERCEKEVERKRKRSCDDQQLPKLLHWPLGKSPLEPLLCLPEWLEGSNWVGSGYAGATFETKLLYSWSTTCRTRASTSTTRGVTPG